VNDRDPAPDLPTAPAPAAPPAGGFRPELAGLFALALLAIVFSWWAWQRGAWFGVVFLPGAILLCAGLLILARVAPWPASLRRSPAAGVALAALLALGGWAALSALWSPAPDVAIADGQRIIVYALAFGLGLWLAVLLGARAQLSLLPLATAGAFAGVIAVVGMITTDRPGAYLEAGGTLEFPLGYRNANAAFFALAFFATLGLASARDLDWRARALALATATLCVGVSMLSQSRGSVPAALIAIVVYVLFSPLRLRAICWLGLALIPALGVVPHLSEIFRAANDVGVGAAGDELRAAGAALAWATGAGLILGAVAGRFERVLPGLGSTSPRANRGIAGVLALGAVAAVVAFVVAVEDPIDWTVRRADEFRAGTPSLSEAGTRFTFNVSTDRYDLWRVALEDAREEPLRGAGAGGFQYTYLRQRETETQTARDAHSIELEVAGELGLPGLVLLLTALGGATWGILRARRRGYPPAALSAIALAAGAYWLAHASIDWFWAYPAITAPVIALLGSACGAGVIGGARRPGAARHLLAAGAVILALTTIPPFLSERYVNEAYAGWRNDLSRAYDDLDRARALNPLDDAPLLAEGAIAHAAKDRRRAITAYRAANEKRPQEWAAHFFLAELFARDGPARARRELDRARQLNPKSYEIDELESRLAEMASSQRDG
jgi:hypothetical protein